MNLEHIGIASQSGQKLAQTFERLFGTRPYKTESVASEGVETVFFNAGGPKLEGLESSRPGSAIARFLGQRGEGLHHIAVEVDDIDAEIVRVRSEGFNVLSEEPFDGADGKRVFFVHPKDCHGILVEFCQQTRPTWRGAEIEMPHGTVTAYSAGSTEASPILLLHDHNSSADEDFNELLPTLERSLHVIAFDAPGHPTARHARAILDSYNIREAAIVAGRGSAAETAIQMARSYPELVRALVLIDPGDSIASILEESRLDKPTLVCSLRRDSIGAAAEIS
ncbi:MAG: methylmalonyl-CoA epimerase, partial [Rhodothermia bacterium]